MAAEKGSATNKEVAKRLSFGELSHSLHGPHMPVSQDVLNAIKAPTFDNLEKAVGQFAALNSERFLKMLEVAQKQCETGDASDLQRLEKQLSMLKNSFQAYDIQEEFMSELLQGKPDGKEQHATEAAHSETQAWSEEVKARKAVNNDTREKMRAAIAELASAHDEMVELQKLAEGELQGLRSKHGALSDIAFAARAVGQNLRCEDPHVEQALQDLHAEACSLEAVTAEHRALAGELEAAIASEQEDLRALASEVQAMEEAAKSNNSKAADKSPKSSKRFQEAGTWYAELEALTAALTGVRLCEAGPDSVDLVLNCPVVPGDGGSSGIVTYRLALEIQSRQDVVLLTGMTLQPSDVQVADIAEAALAASAAAQPGALSMAVREVLARVSASQRRRAELQGLPAMFLVREVEVGSETSLRCQLAGGTAEAELRLPPSWPAPGVAVEVTDIQDVKGSDLKGPVLKALDKDAVRSMPLAELLGRLDELTTHAINAHAAGCSLNANAPEDASPATAMCE